MTAFDNTGVPRSVQSASTNTPGVRHTRPVIVSPGNTTPANRAR